MNNFEEFTEKEEHLSIILEGDNSIQYDTLLSFIETTGKLLKRSSKQVSGSGGQSEIIVTNIGQGSIILDLVAKIKSKSSMIPNQKSPFGTFLDIISIKKHLGDGVGATVEYSGNDAKYINGLGDCLVIDRESSDAYLENLAIDKQWSQTMSKINSDSTRSRIRIVDHSENGVELILDKKDIEKSSNTVDVNSLRGTVKEVVMHNVTVRVEKVDFSGITKWSIHFGSSKENVTIEDFSFLNEVKESKHTFNSHSLLVVDYKIEYFSKFDDENASKIKAKYTILKVHNVINEFIESSHI